MSFHFIFMTNFIRDKNPLYGSLQTQYTILSLRTKSGHKPSPHKNTELCNTRIAQKFDGGNFDELYQPYIRANSFWKKTLNGQIAKNLSNLSMLLRIKTLCHTVSTYV